jgi:hypothetical protein
MSSYNCQLDVSPFSYKVTNNCSINDGGYAETCLIPKSIDIPEFMVSSFIKHNISLVIDDLKIPIFTIIAHGNPTSHVYDISARYSDDWNYEYGYTRFLRYEIPDELFTFFYDDYNCTKNKKFTENIRSLFNKDNLFIIPISSNRLNINLSRYGFTLIINGYVVQNIAYTNNNNLNFDYEYNKKFIFNDCCGNFNENNIKTINVSLHARNAKPRGMYINSTSKLDSIYIKGENYNSISFYSMRFPNIVLHNNSNACKYTFISNVDFLVNAYLCLIKSGVCKDMVKLILSYIPRVKYYLYWIPFQNIKINDVKSIKNLCLFDKMEVEVNIDARKNARTSYTVYGLHHPNIK